MKKIYILLKATNLQIYKFILITIYFKIQGLYRLLKETFFVKNNVLLNVQYLWCGKLHPIAFVAHKSKHTVKCACYYLNSILHRRHNQYIIIFKRQFDFKMKMIKNANLKMLNT